MHLQTDPLFWRRNKGHFLPIVTRHVRRVVLLSAARVEGFDSVEKPKLELQVTLRMTLTWQFSGRRLEQRAVHCHLHRCCVSPSTAIIQSPNSTVVFGEAMLCVIGCCLFVYCSDIYRPARA